MKTLIDLLLESELAEMNDKEAVDEIGKFFIVKKPKKGMTKEDIMCEMTVFDEIVPENVVGVYMKRPAARQKASEVIKEMEANIKELEASMNEFRAAKTDIDTKKQKAAEIIKKLK